jgi:hypothetical protein
MVGRMTRLGRLLLPALACAALVVPATAHAATPMSTSVADAAGDQTKGDRWKKYPGLRKASDLRRATFATAKGTLTMTWTFAATPSNPRAFHSVGMSGALRDKQVTFGAWRHDGRTYLSVSSGLGDDSRFYCKGKGSVALKPAKHQVVVKVPVSCLPKGKVFKAPYPATNLTVLKKSGIVEGYVASDSSVAAPDFAIRR